MSDTAFDAFYDGLKDKGGIGGHDLLRKGWQAGRDYQRQKAGAAVNDELVAVRSKIANLANKLNPQEFCVFERVENSILDNESDPDPESAHSERDHWLINQTWISALVVVDDLIATIMSDAALARARGER